MCENYQCTSKSEHEICQASNFALTSTRAIKRSPPLKCKIEKVGHIWTTEAVRIFRGTQIPKLWKEDNGLGKNCVFFVIIVFQSG